MESGKLRLFLATPLDDGAFEALHTFYRERDAVTLLPSLKASWVKPENWHMTWHFIGDTPSGILPEIEERVSVALAGAPGTGITMGKIDFWPNARQPRLMVWLGESGNRVVADVVSRIRGCFPESAEDRPFKPHITLARLKPVRGECGSGNPGRLQLPPSLCPPPCQWTLRRIGLYQSTLTPQGAIYHCLRTWTLSL